MKTLMIAAVGLCGILATNVNAYTLALQLKADALALADGTPVSAWGSATQGNASQQPIYKTGIGALYGHSAVRFDGVDDTMQVASITLDSDTAIFMVAQFSPSGVPIILEQGANASSNDGFYIHGGQGYSATMNRSGANGWNIGTGFWTGSDYALFELGFDTGTDAWSASINGTALSTAQQNSADIPASSMATNALNIMSRNQSAFFTAGDIAELRIYNGPMTAGERALIAAELNATYFMAAAIPEPASLVLLGGAGLLVVARRRG